jgi:hypothetical protein
MAVSEFRERLAFACPFALGCSSGNEKETIWGDIAQS